MGAVDGKHILLQAPFNSGSEYYIYKSFPSIVLLALVDANFNFIYADIGCQGRISDGGVFKQSKLYKKLTNMELNLPDNATLPGRENKIPFVFIGDEAFALSPNFMGPFSGTFHKGSPQRIFNYRLSRARRVVENVFGIMSAVFRLLRKPLLIEPEKAKYIVMTAVYLHNFLRRNNRYKNLYTPPGTLDSEINGEVIAGSWRQGSEVMTSLIDIKQIPRRSSVNAQQVREEYVSYFTTNGRVPWQEQFA